MARQKQPNKAKEPVKIRFKKLANGNQSIYLDCYKDGKREYEFLKLYLIPETTPFDKQQNAATLKVANAIKAQRVIELANDEAGIKQTQKAKMLLVDWLEHYKQEQERKGRHTQIVDNCINAVTIYKGENTRLIDVDKEYCLGYIYFVQHEYKTTQGKNLKSGTAQNYFRVLNAALNAAKRAEIIKENPFSLIGPDERIKTSESNRVYLTADEVKRLTATNCTNGNVKQAFLFSCYCGLRVSDILNLKWGNVVTDGEQTRVEITIRKTKKALSLPISNGAKRYLPVRGTATDEQPVFSLPSISSINRGLIHWAKAAGITKQITMHTARHTFATLLLTKDVNLKLIQDLLGHANIKTTQIYAKIIDSKKVEAVNVLNEL